MLFKTYNWIQMNMRNSGPKAGSLSRIHTYMN
uniref:Uncharacterized protein n=1 Tax=Rhizophora mucronata TaxID=61149 RepID=A0A2P2ISQ4_RHIMU